MFWSDQNLSCVCEISVCQSLSLISVPLVSLRSRDLQRWTLEQFNKGKVVKSRCFYLLQSQVFSPTLFHWTVAGGTELLVADPAWLVTFRLVLSPALIKLRNDLWPFTQQDLVTCFLVFEVVFTPPLKQIWSSKSRYKHETGSVDSRNKPCV